MHGVNKDNMNKTDRQARMKLAVLMATLFILATQAESHLHAALPVPAGNHTSADSSSVSGSGTSGSNTGHDDELPEDDDLSSTLARPALRRDTLATYTLDGRKATQVRKHTLFIYKGRKIWRR